MVRSVRPSVAKWLFFGAVGIVGLVMAWAVFEGAIRYRHERYEAFGYVVRVDRLTGERCLYSGSDQIAADVELPRCGR